MDLILSSAGSYPRSGPGDDLQVLVRTREAVARGEQIAADLADAENFMVRRAIEEQVAAGIELVTDGLTRWLDPISHLAAKLDGVTLGGERPLPTAPGTYRVPQVNQRPARRAPLLAEEYRFACNALGAIGTPQGKAGKLGVKAVLTGPFTLAKLSEPKDTAIAHLDARAAAFAEALATELGALAEGGAEHIQVDEFAPVEQPGDWTALRAGISALAVARDAARKSGRRVELTVFLHTRDATHWDALFELPADVVALDLSAGAKVVERLAASGASKPLHIGLVSGRTPELEDARELARKLESLLPKLPPGRSFLGPAGGLEALPRDRARAKLELLARVREIVAGRPVAL